MPNKIPTPTESFFSILIAKCNNIDQVSNKINGTMWLVIMTIIIIGAFSGPTSDKGQPLYNEQETMQRFYCIGKGI